MRVEGGRLDGARVLAQEGKEGRGSGQQVSARADRGWDTVSLRLSSMIAAHIRLSAPSLSGTEFLRVLPLPAGHQPDLWAAKERPSGLPPQLAA